LKLKKVEVEKLKGEEERRRRKEKKKGEEESLRTPVERPTHRARLKATFNKQNPNPNNNKQNLAVVLVPLFPTRGLWNQTQKGDPKRREGKLIYTSASWLKPAPEDDKV